MKKIIFLGLCIYVLAIAACDQSSSQADQWQVEKWDKLTLNFTGPNTSENADENPFLNYRLLVSFEHEDGSITVPGFYAADGNAAESGASEGGIWQVRFRPHLTGEWRYKASFRKGNQIAISDEIEVGEPVAFDEQEGIIQVTPGSHPGRLVVTDKHYLKYADSEKYFLKGGADSPENLLGYTDFDGTEKAVPPEQREGEAPVTATLHAYEPHVKDWNPGDPSWKGGKGKGLIGALNYLAGKGMNAVYFLTMNIEGDGKDVWPYTGYDERERFDCSKLDQWEIVFDHMDSVGLMLHMVTQETENEKLLDNGDTGPHRKLYYRELIARFGHHLAVTWNMGEENGPAPFSPDGQNTEQQKAMVEYIKTHDPYENMVVIHSHSVLPLQQKLFTPLLGFPHLDGMSIQNSKPVNTNQVTQEWRAKSGQAGKPWIMCMDELGPHFRGVDPDDRSDNNQDTVRGTVLWGNLMAGGAGVEWYFGYRNHNNDLGCEDWRSRDRVWDFTRHGLEFFQKHLPFTEMEASNEAISYTGDAYCFAKQGNIYAIYLPRADQLHLDLTNYAGSFSIHWFNPRTGGDLSAGSITSIEGGQTQNIGMPPTDNDKDWVALIEKQ